MTTKKLRADFATDRVDFIFGLAAQQDILSGNAPGTITVKGNIGPGPGYPARAEATGPAQDIMHLIGAVAAQGEDFLLLVSPC